MTPPTYGEIQSVRRVARSSVLTELVKLERGG